MKTTEKRRSVSVYLPDSVIDRLTAIAAQDGMTTSRVIARLVTTQAEDQRDGAQVQEGAANG